MLKKRNRNISDDKKLLNLYIRYMRDYRKDEDFKNIEAVPAESKQKISIYNPPLQFTREHIFLVSEYNDLCTKINEEHDNRRKKTLIKELAKLEPYKKRFNYIEQSQKRSINQDSLLHKVVEMYDNMPNIGLEPEAYNNCYDNWLECDGYIELDDVTILVTDIKNFSYETYLISELFGVNMDNKSKEKIILDLYPLPIIENYLPDEYYKDITVWKEKCMKVDSAVKYLINSGYIKKSKEDALKLVTNEDAKWLLERLIKYKLKYNKTISIKQDGKNFQLKSIILHQYFNHLFDLKTARKLTENSTLI